MAPTRSILVAMALLAASLLPAQMRFQHLAMEEGAGANTVRCLHPDASGLLWIGTANGVNVYDGSTVRPVPGTRMDIAAITADKEGTIWAATADQGLLRIRHNGQQVDTLHHVPSDPRSIADDRLTAVYDLNDTTLLIGSRLHSLIFLDKRTLRFSYWTDSLSIAPVHASPTPSPRNGWCHTITRLDPDRLWLGFLNAHVTLVADAHSGAVRHVLRIQRSGSESQTCALMVNGLLYNGGWQKGIDLIDLATVPNSPIVAYLAPRTIDLPDEVVGLAYWSGRILAATRKSGIYVIDPADHGMENIRHSRQDPSSLGNDRIQCLLADHNGTLWAGTANGLDRHVPSVWNTTVTDLFPAQMDTQPDLLFHRLEQQADGTLRAYTSEGFFLVDSSLQHVRQEPVTWQGSPLEPTVCATGRDGTRWLGTEHGVLVYAPGQAARGTGLMIQDNPSGAYPPGSMFQVRGLWPDTIGGQPVLVLGTLGFGAKVADAATGRVIGTAMPPAAWSINARSLVQTMVRTPDGAYWAGTADGVFRWRRGEPLTLELGYRGGPADHTGIVMPGADVRGLLSVDDALWGVTHDGTLFSVRQGHVQRHQPRPDMRSAMHGLAADRQGRIWITTDNALLRFDPADSSFITVPVNDGLRFRRLSKAIITLADGRIAFCADNSLLVLDPGRYKELPTVPTPYLTALSAGGFQVAPASAEVKASYRASLVEVAISALAHGLPMAPSFEYRLEGVDQDWRACPAGEVVRFAAVPVGTHRLLARTHDPFGRIGPERGVLRITVKGPVWQRWWFYAATLLVVSAALYALHRYRLAQAMKLQAVRNRIASDLHDEIGSSLSSITIGSQLAAKLNAQAPAQGSQQVGSLLERIGETSNESLRSMSDIVWAINPKNDQGEALVTRMRRMAEDLLLQKGIQVGFHVGVGVEELRLPMNTRKELLLIGTEAIHNASKHSGAGTVQISLYRRKGLLVLSVKDDGRGFDPGYFADGHGLGSMQRRAKAIGASYSLESTPGQGARIRVEVDLTKIRD